VFDAFARVFDVHHDHGFDHLAGRHVIGQEVAGAANELPQHGDVFFEDLSDLEHLVLAGEPDDHVLAALFARDLAEFDVAKPGEGPAVSLDHGFVSRRLLGPPGQLVFDFRPRPFADLKGVAHALHLGAEDDQIEVVDKFLDARQFRRGGRRRGQCERRERCG